MATSYSTIINAFLMKVKAYKLIALLEDDREEMVNFYLSSACAKFYKKCRHNLLNRDDVTQEFAEELDADEADIISEIMITEWLSPMMYDDELLESRLNTKDFTEYSPAKLIEQIHEVFKTSKKYSKQLIIDYTYSHGDIAEVNKP